MARVDAVERPASGVPPFLHDPTSFILHYVKARRAQFSGLAALVIGASSCAVGVQYGMKLLVDAMAGGDGAITVWGALGFFFVLIAAESALWRLSGVVGCRATVGAGIDIRMDLVRYITGFPMRFFQETFAGALAHRITASAGSFGAIMNKAAWDVAPPIVSFAGALLLFVQLDWQMALALGVFASGFTAALLRFGRRGRPLHTAYARQAGTAGGELVDVLANIWAVKAFSAAGRESARLGDILAAEAAAQRRSWMFLERLRALHDVALCLMAGTLLVWAVVLWSRGRITAGDVVMISTLGFRILQGSRDLSLAFVDIGQNLTQIGETLRLLGRPQAVTDVPNALHLVPLGGSVRFENVSFSYSEGSPVLSDFSLDVAPGEKVGIVGLSGAGKSTLIHLVQRLHDPQRGSIRIDGQPIVRLAQASLRDALAVVPQDLVLFHRSVMDNIRFGRPDATDAEVVGAAEAAHCADFIATLPRGYETMVGERGTMLSGGQRQRIAIARAILKDAPIVLLDEATSSLDAESERAVRRALDLLMKQKTVLAVAHRLSTIAAFDRIVVLSGGAIVESGKPTELVGRAGPFARMWQMHAAQQPEVETS